MYNFDFNIDDKNALLALDAVMKKLIDLSPEFKEIEIFVNSEIQQHITQQKNPDGSTYLSPKAAARIGRNKALDTQNYRKSFTSSIEKNQLVIGSTHPGSLTHEKGLAINIFGRGVLYQFPKRSAVWLSKKALKTISDTIARGF